MSDGISTSPAETLLAERARDLLSAGPSDPVVLIEHVCQMPGAPRFVAEQMAIALFAGRPEFLRDGDGRWWLASHASAPVRIAEHAPSAPYAAVHPHAPSIAGPPLTSLPYVVVDVETTGTSPWAGDRVTEIAAVIVRDGVVAEPFETLINPEPPIPPFITALPQISWDMVKDAPRFRDICGDLLRHMHGNIFVAHNADFDWRFLSAEVERATGEKLRGRRLCTVRLARRILPQLRSRKLDFVADYYNVEISARHRAGGDAIATAHVLLRLLQDARAHSCECWDDLERLLGARTARARRGRRPPALPRPVDRDTTA
jgi:DNA polymerase-3 subunit epsilon